MAKSRTCETCRWIWSIAKNTLSPCGRCVLDGLFNKKKPYTKWQPKPKPRKGKMSDVRVNPWLPKGTVLFVDNGEIVGKIINVGNGKK